LQVPAHGKVEVIEWAAQDRPRINGVRPRMKTA
jgi:hypothetical protein